LVGFPVAGAVQLTVPLEYSAETLVNVGALGIPFIVTLFELLEYELVPTELTAATLNTYEVPAVRLETIVEVDVLVPSLNVVHVEPLFDEYWTM
jgi:hypothetical protein